MKINEIIKERRQEKGMTQEQIANRLGVTTPAVNKWEKGVSYPDITVLPALARLLDTDLNTLLSFKDDLSDREVGEIVNEVSEISVRDGFKEAYDYAMDKLSEYPNCYSLVLSTAVVLEGAIAMDEKMQNIKYEESIEKLYMRSLGSSDERIRNRAQSMLFSKYVGRKELDKAQEIIDGMPEKNPVDKKQLQANLHTALGEWDEAAKIYEERLLSSLNEVQGALVQVLDIAIKQERLDDARYIAEVSRKSAELFDQWEYQGYVAPFGLYFATKDIKSTVEILSPMLKSLTKKWDMQSSPLYRHVPIKETDASFGTRIQKMVVESLYKDEQAVFLKDCPEVQQIINNLHLD